MNSFRKWCATIVIVATAVMPVATFAAVGPETIPGCPVGALYNYMTGALCPTDTTNGGNNGGSGSTNGGNSDQQSLNGASFVITSGPILKTTYDASNREASLVTTMNVKITAGQSQVIVPISAFQVNIHQITGDHYVSGGTASFTRITGGTDTGSYTQIPAGQSATFAVSASFTPSILFAGQYYASLDYLNLGVTGDINSLASFTGPTNKSNTVTIIGERSPYINSVTVSSATRVVVTGIRFANYQNEIYIDGKKVATLPSVSHAARTVIFNPSLYGTGAGSHSLWIVHPITGKSNDWTFTIPGDVVINPNPGSCTFTRDMTIGSRGSDVEQLQNILVAKGFLVLSDSIRGYFEDATQHALAKFQASVGIAPANGFFGPIERAYIAANNLCQTSIGDSNLIVSLSPQTPATQTLTVTPTKDAAGATVLLFIAQSNGGTSKINSVTLDWYITNGPGYPAAFYLYNSSGTMLASVSTNANKELTFSNLNLLIGKDSVQTFVVKADFPTTMADGTQVTTAISGISYSQPNGTVVVNSTKITGNPVKFSSGASAATANVTIAASPSVATTLGVTGSTASIVGTFVMDVQARDGAVSIPADGSSFVGGLYLGDTLIASSTHVNLSVANTIPNSTTGGSGSNYVIPQNAIYRLTYSVAFDPSSIPNLSTNTYRLKLNSLGYNTNKSVDLGFNTNPFNVTAGPAVQPSITVTSPNGGEVYPAFSTINFTWKSQGGDRVTMYLTKPDGTMCQMGTAAASDKGIFVLPNTSATDGFPCNTPDKKITFGKYKLKVYLTYGSIISLDNPVGLASDSSDDFFTIGPVMVTGDTNGDGKVDFQDLVNVSQHMNTNSAIGDVNGDGKTDINDLAQVTNAYNQSNGISTPVSASEVQAAVNVAVASSIAGDTNHDYKVDFTDLVAVAQHMNMTGTTLAAGDVNGDSQTNWKDLIIVSSNYGKSAPVPTAPKILGDINGDGKVDQTDTNLVSAAYGSHTGDAKFNAAADFNQDGVINFTDMVVVSQNFGQTNPVPAVKGASTSCIILTNTLAKGSMDAYADGEVTELQQFLITQGFGFPDLGTFGALTEQSVKSWQGTHGIEQTGIVGPLTRSAIQTVSCK